ncbi:hypothetical protein B0T20DRAFT_353359 [Sordaria brevicollis]|uniref:N-acetyltransferase domain-containing protein n=1 Tax=Sordaria brevicollis TaxID=83679 RepID=A0AAE0PE54_SORBR|nr:hypothetical protein B0T20DRAFT_353359 [Sordaria brevicollis]
MPLDPQWDYRFPLRKQFPEDHYKYTRMLFEYFLDPSFDDWTVMVVEDVDPASSEKLRIASISVDKRGGRTRRDVNQEHFDAFGNGQAKAYKKFFGSIGPDQLHLQILATLPEFHRRGHATTLCRWGMDVIRRESLKDISVMASPMGYNLYAHLGFSHVATVIIQVPGEEEKLTLQAMKYDSVQTSFTSPPLQLVSSLHHKVLIPEGFSFIIFSLALINSPNVHSDNIRGQLAKPATITTTISTSTLSTGNHTLQKPTGGANFITALPTDITTTPPTITPTLTPIAPTSSSSSIFLPFETCLLAIFSLAVEIPTPSPALSTALSNAEYSLPPSAVAAPSCTITLPASLSSVYDVYTSSLDRWVSQHSKELEKLDSVCGETYTETGTGSMKTEVTTKGTGVVGCTAPVAVFTSTVSSGGSGSGSGSSTVIGTTTLFKASTGTGVVTSTTSKKTGTTTTGSVEVTTTTSTVTSSVTTTSSITGSATTVAVVTSSQPPTEPQGGGAVRVTGVITAMMVMAGFWAVLLAL